MRAVILVGGQGSRLRPLTYTMPKQLLRVAEVTMIERVVAHLADHGVDDVVLSMGYLPDAFEGVFPDDRCAGLPLSYAVEPEPLDTAGAIRFAARASGIESRFLVFNGDVLTDLDISALVNFHEKRGAEGTIALTRVDDPSAFGVVPTDAEGCVTAFVEKPRREEAPTDYVNAGVYVLEPSVLDRIPAEGRASIERETFPAMVAEGGLYAMRSGAYWIDAGTPAKYLEANLDCLVRRSPPPSPDAVERDPGIWTIGAAVLEGSLEAPVLVGDAALVERGALVRDSVVGAGARVHAGARVVGSVLLPGAVVREEATVSESVIGEAAVVGERAEVGGHSVVGGGAEVAADARLHNERMPEE